MLEETLNEVKKVYDQNEPIRLEGFYKRNLPKTFSEFLVNFFTEYNLERNTIYCNNKTVQTSKGKRRSLSDLYMLVKYYYPKITLRELILTLREFCRYKDGFRSSYCYQMKKRAFYYSSVSGNCFYETTNTDCDINLCLDKIINELENGN